MSKSVLTRGQNEKDEQDLAQRKFEKHLLLLNLTAEIMKAAIASNGLVSVTSNGKRKDGLAAFAKDVYAALDDAHNSSTAK